MPCLRVLTQFWTELHDSLTAFYKKILKNASAGGRPVAKPLIRKLVTKTAHVPEAAPSCDTDADADAVESPSANPAPPPAPAAEAAAAPPEKPAPQLKAAKGSALLSGAGPRDD